MAAVMMFHRVWTYRVNLFGSGSCEFLSIYITPIAKEIKRNHLL